MPRREHRTKNQIQLEKNVAHQCHYISKLLQWQLHENDPEIKQMLIAHSSLLITSDIQEWLAYQGRFSGLDY